MEEEVTQVVYEYPPYPSVGEMIGLTCGLTACLTACFILVIWIHSLMRD